MKLKLRYLASPAELQLMDELYVKDWYKARSQAWVPMPKISWVVETDELGPVAVGGLIRTDSEFAMVDGYATSPKISTEEGYRALEVISRQALKSAKELGYERCLCLTRIPSMTRHAKLMKAREDFKGYELLAIHLADWSFDG